ncbi:MAG: hypothetical protein CVU41_15485 [Chloroflexi bacterium HGW-Chloroflexi-3]|nr:MAG: hypothetical protein CVU41_15485 [Chloroflexi bacterium HGW-Chloroflexi-3]
MKGEHITRPDIKNLNDLNDYLTTLEERIAVLEQEDRTIKGAINEINHDLQSSKRQEVSIPATGLLSHNFFTRAFAVWGHYFVASLIIGLILSFVYLVVAVKILGSSINFFTQLMNILTN